MSHNGYSAGSSDVIPAARALLPGQAAQAQGGNLTLFRLLLGFLRLLFGRLFLSLRFLLFTPRLGRPLRGRSWLDGRLHDDRFRPDGQDATTAGGVEVVNEDRDGVVDGFSRSNRAVSFDIHHQLVEVGDLADAGILHVIADLAHRRVDRVDGDDAQFSLLLAALLGRDITAAAGDENLNLQFGVLFGQSGDVQVRIDDFHVGILLDVRARRFRVAFGVQLQTDRFVRKNAHPEGLQVQDDFQGIFLHARQSRELVGHALDLDRGHGRAGQRGQENATQGIADGGAVAVEARFDDQRPLAALVLTGNEFD